MEDLSSLVKARPCRDQHKDYNPGESVTLEYHLQGSQGSMGSLITLFLRTALTSRAVWASFWMTAQCMRDHHHPIALPAPRDKLQLKTGPFSCPRAPKNHTEAWWQDKGALTVTLGAPHPQPNCSPHVDPCKVIAFTTSLKSSECHLHIL